MENIQAKKKLFAYLVLLEQRETLTKLLPNLVELEKIISYHNFKKLYILMESFFSLLSYDLF